MKIERLYLSRYKKFRDREIRFDLGQDPDSSVVSVLVGSNGSGKSSVLQAIAATLGAATRRLRSPKSLDWVGFNPDLLNSAHGGPFEVKLDVVFSEREIVNTRSLFEEFAPYIDSRTRNEPASEQKVRLTFKDDKVIAPTAAQLFQFRGREYAKYLFSNNKAKFDVFEKVGSCLWYTENRTSTSLTPETSGAEEEGKPTKLEFDETVLRRQMNALFSFHNRVKNEKIKLREGQRDIMHIFETYYKLLFPNRGLSGTVPRANVDQVLEEAWFKLHDSAHEYEISEMSGAERALFPILFDFANWNIHNSVVLIDELELHLHPPLQQRFLNSLFQLGKNNHFIITTHSDWVLETLSTNQIIRIDGGDMQ
jgi:predicted ATP-dependent endonuclease of OLD family